jgi:hypothetical protein
MTDVKWKEYRLGELHFVEANWTGSGWDFREQSTYDVRSFSVPPKAGWIEKANRLAKVTARDSDPVACQDGQQPEDPHLPAVEVGSFHDNASVLAIANWNISRGAVREGLKLLSALRTHIVGMSDPKSLRILLPAVEDAIYRGSLLETVSESSADEMDVTAHRCRITPVEVASSGRESHHLSSDNISHFKLQLVNAVGLVVALSWTHSLLVHEVMTLPGVEVSPIRANAIAGSILVFVLGFACRGGRG